MVTVSNDIYAICKSLEKIEEQLKELNENTKRATHVMSVIHNQLERLNR